MLTLLLYDHQFIESLAHIFFAVTLISLSRGNTKPAHLFLDILVHVFKLLHVILKFYHIFGTQLWLPIRITWGPLKNPNAQDTSQNN